MCSIHTLYGDHMTVLNVYERGLDFLRLCLDYYSENCAFLMLFFIALVFVCIKGNETEKRIFIPSGLFLFLTVYNPICPVILIHFFDVNSEYYRFFWIAPVVILLPFVAVKLIEMLDNKWGKIGLFALIVLLFITSGNFLYSNGYEKAENIYKMPGELITVSEVIHSDANVEYPKAFLEYEYNMQMRQYDPKIMLTVDREDYLRAISLDFSEEEVLDDNHPQYRILATLVKQKPVDMSEFLEALELSHTEYVVLDKNNPMTDYLETAGLESVGETENNRVYKYNLKESYEFSLVDYSVVY